MSRTYRRRPWRMYRRPKTTNTRRGEQNISLDTKEQGVKIKHGNRQQARGNPSDANSQIPTAYDDIPFNAWDEIPECKWKSHKNGEICK